MAGGSDHPNGPDPAVEVDICHGGELVGRLAVDDTALGGPQPQRRRELLTDVADSLGLVLQASRAGVALERQLRAAVTYATDIAAARRTLVAAMDRERRRIERDLHDGVQHHLTCLRVTLGLVDHQIATAQLGPARSRLDQLVEGLDVAEAVLAETAHGVSAPLLAELGLVQALRTGIQGATHRSRSTPHPTSTTGWCPAPSPPRSTTAASEAVGNARKHTPSATITVRLRPDGDWLRVNVVDDGIGFDTTTNPHPEGRGLRNVAARIGSVGGHVAISSTPGHGTTVEASVPLPRRATPRPGGPRRTASTPLDTARPWPSCRHPPARPQPASPPGVRRCGPRGSTTTAPRTRRVAAHPGRTARRTAPYRRPRRGNPDQATGHRQPADRRHRPGGGPPTRRARRRAAPPPPRPDIHRTVHRPQRTARSTRPHRRHGRRARGDQRAQRGRDGVATIDHTPPLRGPRTAESPDRAANTEGPRDRPDRRRQSPAERSSSSGTR